jgi:(2Fe-2S) ferredoxin
MSKYQKSRIQPLIGEFVGWGDDRIPHRYIKLATATGERVAKVAKSLRPQIQDWQPGIWVTLLGEERVNLATGETKIKVKQVLVIPRIQAIEHLPPALSLEPVEHLPVINDPPPPTQIRVCQGSSCRRRGSEGICQVMQTYLDRHDLTDRVKIEPVKCLHQCKAAPHAIVIEHSSKSPEKTHYRQIQPCQIEKIIDRHFAITPPVKPSENELITQIGNYLQQQFGSMTTAAHNSSN